MKRLTLLLVLLLAAPAQAGTIKASWDPKFGDSYSFDATPGQRNAIAIERVRTGFRLTDSAGAPTGDCVAESAAAVLCSIPADLYVQAGDGDDTLVDRDGVIDDAHGGPGDDRLEVTAGARLTGDDGDDTLIGSPHKDRIEDGAGRRDRRPTGPRRLRACPAQRPLRHPAAG